MLNMTIYNKVPYRNYLLFDSHHDHDDIYYDFFLPNRWFGQSAKLH